MPDRVPFSDEPLLTIRQVADHIGISEGTVRSIRASGALPIVRPSPGTIRVRPQDLRQYIEERREAPGPFGRRRRS